MSKSPSPDRLVAYYRVSTARQGQSGLGLEAQRAAVTAHVAQTGATLLSEFTEVESGRKDQRLELRAALVQCRTAGAVLVIAKLDRLSRDAGFLIQLQKGDVEFRALDLPGASKFHLGIMALVAEHEADAISARTKAALAAAKARGTKLGNPAHLTDRSRARSIAVRQAQAVERHRHTLPLVRAWDALGWSFQQMADALTEAGAPLPRPTPGRPPVWQWVQARRLLALAQRQPPTATDEQAERVTKRAARADARRAAQIAERRAHGDAAEAPEQIIRAKWAGRCGRCRHDYWDGDPVLWVKGSRPRHATPEACDQAAAWATEALALARRRDELVLSPKERAAIVARCGELLTAHTWQFARTMASSPHWYTLRRTWASDADFAWVVEQIRLVGRREKYGGAWYTVLDVDGFFYWSMGAPIPITVLINRKPLAAAAGACGD